MLLKCADAALHGPRHLIQETCQLDSVYLREAQRMASAFSTRGWMLHALNTASACISFPVLFACALYHCLVCRGFPIEITAGPAHAT